MRKKGFIALAACVGLLAMTPLAQAVPLPPGADVAPNSVAMGGGTVVGNGFGLTTYTITNGMGGVQTVSVGWNENVVSGRAGNPLGGLSFELSFSAVYPVGNATPVQSVSSANWNGWTVDASFFMNSASNTPPSRVSRTNDGWGINWTFTAVQGSGNTTSLLIMDTNAPAFQPGDVHFAGYGSGADGNPLGGTTFLVPSPEPATLTLALVGLPLAGAFGYRRLRRGRPA
jgi:hypothetical protein